MWIVLYWSGTRIVCFAISTFLRKDNTSRYSVMLSPRSAVPIVIPDLKETMCPYARKELIGKGTSVSVGKRLNKTLTVDKL